MEYKKLHTLSIDEGFKSLIRPLQKREYIQLESNLLIDGCREPIVIWDRYIIDGHNRYEICTKHQIPFAVVIMEFDCRESAIAWICANQLGRRNITDETRKFLIGMQYEAEKVANTLKNARGKNQYDKSKDEAFDNAPDSNKHITAQRIGEENQLCSGTVIKYATYTRALESIGKKVPEMVPNILSGKYKISHNNVVELSRLPADEIRKIGRRIEKIQEPFIQYNKTRQEINRTTDRIPIPSTPSVKDMPAFDPDAEVTGLTLTIPSWASSIERTRTKTNLGIVSGQARSKLESALVDLQNKITEMISAIREED